MTVDGQERPPAGWSARELSPDLDRRLSGDLDALEDFAAELARSGSGRRSAELQAETGSALVGLQPSHINADQDSVEHDLGKLVLALIELLRRLLEKQALRRIDAGTVSEEEIERMGQTFLRLDRRMEELKETFGLKDEDLNLNLGPLGDLL